MNEEVKFETKISTDKESNLQNQVNSDSENKEIQENLTNVQTNSETDLQTYTIVIDGKESNYLIETYKEMKVTNMYLFLILMAIVLIFVLNKFYYYFKNIFTIKF